jgi:hypothetical protein
MVDAAFAKAAPTSTTWKNGWPSAASDRPAGPVFKPIGLQPASIKRNKLYFQ